MANKNTNPGCGKDDNEMRIQFGLILALCQNCAISHNPLFHAQNSNLFKLLSPMFIPDVYPMFKLSVFSGSDLEIFEFSNSKVTNFYALFRVYPQNSVYLRKSLGYAPKRSRKRCDSRFAEPMPHSFATCARGSFDCLSLRFAVSRRMSRIVSWIGLPVICLNRR